LPKNDVENIIGELSLAFIDSSLYVLGLRDSYTSSHCANVGMISAKIAQNMGLSDEFSEEIALAGRAHDIGKIVWPDRCFTDAKLEDLCDCKLLMAEHPTYSKAYLCKALEPLYRDKCKPRWVHWVWLHHWGYSEEFHKNPKPSDVTSQVHLDEEFELGFCILHVADAFHAGTSVRKYRGADPKDVRVVLDELITGSGTNYNPEVVAQMLKMEKWLNGVCDYNNRGRVS